jgi:hypothetical protein
MSFINKWDDLRKIFNPSIAVTANIAGRDAEKVKAWP